MQHFRSDGLDLAFFDEGAGAPILLIHGFGTTAKISWRKSGWVDLLVGDGRRVISPDLRGHGESAKLYDAGAYGMAACARDAGRLLDHLEVTRADVMGYSMGARIAALVAVGQPKRVRSLIIGGMGVSLVKGMPPNHNVARALEGESGEAIAGRQGSMFRQLVDSTGGDRKALAANMRCAREPVDPQALGALSLPVLVAIGTQDTIAGPIGALAPVIPHAELFDIPGRDHMRALADQAFKQTVVEFLSRRA